MAEHPESKPKLLFDGDCGFCGYWVERWSRITGDRVEYVPYQDVAANHPQIPPEKFRESVIFVDERGETYAGAEAVFHAWATAPGKGAWLWAYQNLPGFQFLAEAWYRRVARNRPLFSRITRWVYGSYSPEEATRIESYFLTRRLFLSSLGIVYFCAFLSLGFQIRGLVGSQGILPAADFFEFVGQRLGADGVRLLPSLFWISATDPVLEGACWLGALLSLALVLGIAPILILPLLWILYLSLFYAGQVFLGYQWDILLLETGFLAIFLAPFAWKPRAYRESAPSRLVIWLFRWLLFRLMFSSALVKYLSGDVSWRNLTALEFHYETQPLPTWIGYYLHQLPSWFHRLSTVGMFIVEGFVPFFIFAPRRLRFIAGSLLITLQILIFLSGNYGFFNLLSVTLCLLLFDDYFWPRAWQRWYFREAPPPRRAHRRNWPRVILCPLAGLLIFLSLPTVLFHWEEKPLWVRHVISFFSPYRLVGNYGLFAVMTKTRPEITVEGSSDGIEWKPYVFPYKPGPLNRRPTFVAPHQPRLDWQMWFAALAPFRTQYWFQEFLLALLRGSPEVISLLQENPFPHQPPHWVRAAIADYEFTIFREKRGTGHWWEKGTEKTYSPAIRLP